MLKVRKGSLFSLNPLPSSPLVHWVCVRLCTKKSVLTGACKAGEQDREAGRKKKKRRKKRGGGGADREEEVWRGRGGEEYRGGQAAPL